MPAPPPGPLRAFKLVLEYDGTNYAGWQLQPGASTVQGVLEERLGRLLAEPVRVHGAGRTDAGVHALGQVAHIHTHTGFEAERLRHSLNGMLPRDVSVREVEEVGLDFHARFSARGKTYTYRILNRRTRSALLARQSWHVARPLELQTLRRAMDLMIGEHDFAAFCAANADTTTTVRTLWEARLDVEGDLLALTFRGNGFLKQMVRSVVGTLVKIGVGDAEGELMSRLLAPGPRSLVGPTAPPQGLVLVEVVY